MAIFSEVPAICRGIARKAKIRDVVCIMVLLAFAMVFQKQIEMIDGWFHCERDRGKIGH